MLREQDTRHVGLIALFWSEGGRIEGEKQHNPDGSWQREVRQTITLKPYFIPNHNARKPFAAYDLYAEYFGDVGTVMRNPYDGQLHPGDPDEYKRLAATNELPSAPGETDQQPLSPVKDSFSAYLRLKEPFPVPIGPLGFLVGDRRFLIASDDKTQALLLELKDRLFRRIATIDMRAWIGQIELLFHVEWDGEDVRFGCAHPNRQDRVWARARVLHVRR